MCCLPLDFAGAAGLEDRPSTCASDSSSTSVSSLLLPASDLVVDMLTVLSRDYM